MDLIKKLYTNTKTDVTIHGVGFHSYVLKVVFESYQNDVFQGNVFEHIGDVIDTYELKDMSPIFEEFKKVVYFATDITPELAMYVYILLDYLGNLDTFIHLFKHIDSVELLEHLLCYSTDKHFVRHVSHSTKGKITKLLDVSEKMFDIYVEKMETPELLREYLREKKDTISQHNYAYMLCEGFGEKEEVKARELFWMNWEKNKNIFSLSIYANLLYNGLGGEKDEKKARELHWVNWEENKNSVSLNSYAVILCTGEEKDEKKARELFWLNWEENKNRNSLRSYAIMLHNGLGGEKDDKKAREFFWVNWEETRDSVSLYNYTCMLSKGEGGEKDEKKARELHWVNWEENKQKVSLYNYTCMLYNGTGGGEDRVKARELFRKNWEENKHVQSLKKYIMMLEHGIGGEDDQETAQVLRVYDIPLI